MFAFNAPKMASGKSLLADVVSDFYDYAQDPPAPVALGPGMIVAGEKDAFITIKGINPYVNVVLHEERLEADNVMDLFSQYDLIVDGTDNFATRYMVNDAAYFLGIPYVWGSIYRFDGQASAHGGIAAGDGGRIEISSNGTLDVGGGGRQLQIGNPAI